MSRHAIIVLVCFLMFLALSSSLAASMSHADVESAVVARVNQERQTRGLPLLSPDPALQKAAQWMAEDLARRGQLDHTDSRRRDMKARLQFFGYQDPHIMAENVAAGPDTPETVVEQWLRSRPHRANMLNPDIREVGVGHARNSAGISFWVLDLGTSFAD